MERNAVAEARIPVQGDSIHRQSARPLSARHPIADLQSAIGNQAVRRLIDSPYRRHPIADMQTLIGNQAVQQLINSPYGKTEFNVSSPGDQFEQELIEWRST